MRVMVADLLRFFEWAEAQKVWDAFYIDETEEDYDEATLRKLPPTDKVKLDGILCSQSIDGRNDDVVIFDGIALKHSDAVDLAAFYRKWAKKQTVVSVVVTVGSAADLLELETWAGTKGWKVSK